MASTTINLLIPLIATAQNLKEITANSAFDALDEALCAGTTITMPDADLTLSNVQALQNIFLQFKGQLSSNRHVILPTGSAKLLIVQNDTWSAGGSYGLYALIFEGGTNAQVYVSTDENPHLIWWDGVGKVYKIS